MRQALDDLGITEQDAAEMGLRVYKIAMPWPLEPEGVRHFAEGLEEILVVEEKRQIVEYQLKEQLYNWRDDVRPRVVGKFDEKGEWVRPHGDWLLPAAGELTPAMIARVIARRIERLEPASAPHGRAARARGLDQRQGEGARASPRSSSCASPTSARAARTTRRPSVPEGSRATAGIGCHVMAIWMDRGTGEFTQMGGEGVPWIGQAPFTEEKHIFANLGDGTYYHSGILAIRAAVAANVNITYKILYNDAVAMTGGQPIDGPLTPADIARQVAAEGVKRIIVVSDEPDKYPSGYFASDIRIHHRDELDAVQRELREIAGVTVLLYDQTCAAEKRRRRKRGKFADPGQARRHQRARVRRLRRLRRAIELRVGRAGRDRVRAQARDRPVVVQQGLFVPQGLLSLVRHRRRRHAAQAAEGRDRATSRSLPDPVLPSAAEPYNILVTGVGGTGVVTIGALLGMAAHLESQGLQRARHDGPRAEERRGRVARAHRRHAGEALRDAHRRRRSVARARLRHPDRAWATKRSPRCRRA